MKEIIVLEKHDDDITVEEVIEVFKRLPKNAKVFGNYTSIFYKITYYPDDNEVNFE